MRINLKKLVFFFSFFLLLLSEITVKAQEQDDNLPAFQKELNQKFKAGVNISYFENY